jgi:hypothetical protein
MGDAARGVGAAAADVPADSSTRARLGVGEAVGGSIDFAGDEDWYRFEATAGRTYLLELERGLDLTSPMLALFDADGSFLDADTRDVDRLALGFRATLDGPLFVAASSVAAEPGGTYTLGAREIVGDIPEDVGTNAVLGLGVAVTGRVDFPGDSDWYRLHTEAGRTYLVELARGGPGSFEEPLLRVFDAGGNELGGRLGDPDGVRLGITAPVDGPLFVAAGTQLEADGTYRLSATLLPDDVPGNATTTATLAVADRLPGTIDFAGDQDWYRVEVRAGTTYLFALEGETSGAGSLPDPTLQLLDALGNSLAFDDDGGLGLDAQLAFSAASGATIFLVAAGFDDSVGSYVLNASIVEGDVPDNPRTPARLRPGGAVEGAVDFTADSDWYRIDLAGGQTYVFDLEGAASGGGTLDAAALALHAADGELIVEQAGGGVGLDARLGFTAETDGRFFIAARGLDDATGSYTLRASRLDGDVTDNAGTTARLPIGGVVAGRIDFPSDADWYRVTVEAGRTYLLDLSGGTGADALSDPTLELYDTDGNLIGSDLDSGPGLDAQLAYRADVQGVVFVAARHALPEAGAYVLRSLEVAGEVPDDAATPAELRLGRYESGTVDFVGDIDRFRLAVEAGQTYVIDLEGLATLRGTLDDPRLEVVGVDDSLIASDDDGGAGTNAQLGFVAPADGLVFIRASGFEDATGSYAVLARELAGDVAGDATTTARLRLGGEVRGTIDFTSDVDAYRVQVEAGETYVFELRGQSSGVGALRDPLLVLQDASGVLAADDDSGPGLDSRLVLTAFETGELLLTAQGIGDNDRGSYRLAAREYGGELLTDLPRLVEGRALPELALQPPDPLLGNGLDELLVTWIGGEAALASSVGMASVDELGRLGNVRLLFPSTAGLRTGEAVSLGIPDEGQELALFVVPDGAREIPGLRSGGPEALLLRSPSTGATASLLDELAPELVALHRGRLELVDAPVVLGVDALSAVAAPARVTAGSFTRADEAPAFTVLAFEDGADRDFNDVVLALSRGPIAADDLAFARDYLLG